MWCQAPWEAVVLRGGETSRSPVPESERRLVEIVGPQHTRLVFKSKWTVTHLSKCVPYLAPAHRSHHCMVCSTVPGTLLSTRSGQWCRSWCSGTRPSQGSWTIPAHSFCEITVSYTCQVMSDQGKDKSQKMPSGFKGTRLVRQSHVPEESSDLAGAT